ncbi:MAG: hypothetical protein JOZ69_05510, partial [Myxococcales bacterium]|nr:hypothetical protein [Myxococcales bacterium]
DPARLALSVRVDGAPRDGDFPLSRRGPGIWAAEMRLPAGLGGSNLTVGATFDGAEVVASRTVPIATDVWAADYPPAVRGSRAGCALVAAASGGPSEPRRAGRGSWAWAAALLGLAAARRRGARPAPRVPDEKFVGSG